MADEKITQATKDAERQEARAEHGATETLTPEEEAAAERAGAPSDDTREHYQEMTEKGANQKGEGRLP